jgi:hypothetical protein
MSEEQVNYKTRKQTIFRTIKDKENPFVMMDRRPIENPNLSWKAKGILAYLLSRPDNWIVRLGDLVKRSTDKTHAIRGAIRELERAGHVSRKEVRGENGQFLRYELEVYELPFTSQPLSGFPQADNPQAENLTLNDTDCNETELNDIGVPPTFPIEWQIAGENQTVMVTDDFENKAKDAAGIIATGMGVRAEDAYWLALAFMQTRKIIFTESQIKGQRKATRALLEAGVCPPHIREAVERLISDGMTVTDLYSVTKTAINIANPLPVSSGMNPQGLQVGF